MTVAGVLTTDLPRPTSQCTTGRDRVSHFQGNGTEILTYDATVNPVG